MIEKLYANVHARLVNVVLIHPFEYNSGLKQGCELAPALYGDLCSELAEGTCPIGRPKL